MGLSLGLRLGTRLEQQITIQQRLLAESLQLGLRLELIGLIRDERYEPEGNCPKCRRKLTAVEIYKGFRQDDPNDFTTLCTGCNHRFQPILVCFGNGSRLELPFYCSNQMLAQLGRLSNLSPQEISREHPAIYRSAIIHYGNIMNAFRQIGVDYQHTDIPEWEGKTTPFLGRLPDKEIAEIVNVSVYRIRKLRNDLRISRFSKRKMLEELDED